MPSDTDAYEKLSTLIETRFEELKQMILCLEEKIDTLFQEEELTEEEEKELERIRAQMDRGEYYTFEEVFGEEDWSEPFLSYPS